MRVLNTIAASQKYVGSGMYKGLTVVISSCGFASGWRYRYQLGIHLNDVSFVDCGETLESLLVKGIIEYRETVTTGF